MNEMHKRFIAKNNPFLFWNILDEIYLIYSLLQILADHIIL